MLAIQPLYSLDSAVSPSCETLIRHVLDHALCNQQHEPPYVYHLLNAALGRYFVFVFDYIALQVHSLKNRKREQASRAVTCRFFSLEVKAV